MKLTARQKVALEILRELLFARTGPLHPQDEASLVTQAYRIADQFLQAGIER